MNVITGIRIVYRSRWERLLYWLRIKKSRGIEIRPYWDAIDTHDIHRLRVTSNEIRP